MQHIHLLCNELEPMVAFWEAVCGAKLEARRKFSGGAPGAIMDLNSTTKLYIKQGRNKLHGTALTPEERQKAAGLNHIGFVVEDIEATCKAVSAVPGVQLCAGASPPGPYFPLSEAPGGTRLFFVRGPEDILVEFVQPGAASK